MLHPAPEVVISSHTSSHLSDSYRLLELTLCLSLYELQCPWRMHSQHSIEALPKSGPNLRESTASLLNDKIHVRESTMQPVPASSAGKTQASIIRSFQWELSCFSLSTISFVALIAILWYCHDREAPEWKTARGDITLNAIISIVSTVFRSSLSFTIAQSISQLCWSWYTEPRPLHDLCYYDSASRGPWGSFQLLVRLRFMYIPLLARIKTSK